MFRQRISILLCSAVASAAIACAADSPATSVVTAAVGCVGSGCDGNTPVMAGLPFLELERSGKPNEQGFQIIGFNSPGGASYQLDVQQAKLVGLDASGRVALQDGEVVGSMIKVRDVTGASWDIEVLAASVMQFWALPDDLAATYELRVTASGTNNWQNLCTVPPGSEWPGVVTHAILFEGDRYDLEKREVWATGSETDGWFNVACAGSAIAKMYLTRHTSVSKNAQHLTSLAERQALLRAFTATECPGSDSFTGRGESVKFVDAWGLLPEPADLSHLESVWNADGAICIGEQRLVDPNSMSKSDAEALLAKLPTQCPQIPSCDTFAKLPADWRSIGGMVLTLNPPF